MTNTLIHGIIDALSGSVSKEVICISDFHDSDPGTSLVHFWLRDRSSGSRCQQSIPLCIIGNIIPVPFILLLITPVFNWMKGTKTFKPLVDKLENRAMSGRIRLRNMSSGGWYFL